MKNIWQIAAGEQGRYYDDLFVNHNIMFMGPGDFGVHDDLIYSNQVSEGLITNHRKHQISKFVNDPKEGDVVLLRKGYVVSSIGVITDDTYLWDNRFDDVFGWDLQHTRRVCWQNEFKAELDEIQNYDSHSNNYLSPIFESRKQIPTFTGVEDKNIIDPIKHLFDKVKKIELGPLELSVPNPLSLDDFGEMLFGKGLANDSVDQVINVIKRQRRLGKWYNKTLGQNRPSESELVAYLILPLLLGLGWSEQLLAVEWQKVDLAGFSSTPSTNNNCTLVCEAKHMWHPLMPALDQARNYVKKLELIKCNRIMLTDGLRIYLFEKENEKWGDEPTGYININLLRTNHLAPKNTNAIETLMKLGPINTK